MTFPDPYKYSCSCNLVNELAVELGPYVLSESNYNLTYFLELFKTNYAVINICTTNVKLSFNPLFYFLLDFMKGPLVLLNVKSVVGTLEVQNIICS